MSYIVFKNKGVMDRQAVTTFGASSKENEGAIGFFGTGLKYAIAILLREGCTISIYAGKSQPMEFGVKSGRFRVDTFDFVTLNGRKLGFTTEVGKTWEMWQAFRELWCNAMDENGEAFLTGTRPEPEAGYTTIIVHGEAFLDVWAERSKYILSSQPLEVREGVEIHPGMSDVVFYRGMRAYRLDQPSVYTYNITRKCDLTEDRTIKHWWDVNQAIRAGLTHAESESIIRTAVTASKGTFEAAMDFGGSTPDKPFLKVVAELTREFNGDLNETARKSALFWNMDQLHETTAKMKLNEVDQARLDKACDFCEGMGFNVREYPIIVSEYLGEEVLGRAHDGRIYISKRTLMMGTKMLVGTLMEEFIHLRHKLYDETRTMQNFLIDTIVSLAERVNGEPL